MNCTVHVGGIVVIIVIDQVRSHFCVLRLHRLHGLHGLHRLCNLSRWRGRGRLLSLLRRQDLRATPHDEIVDGRRVLRLRLWTSLR